MDKGDGDKSRTTASSPRISRYSSSTSSSRAPTACPNPTTGKWRRPAADLDDAPILIGEVPDDDPGARQHGRVEDDTSSSPRPRPTSTSCSPSGSRRTDQAAALAAERARWQKRVDALQRSLAERDQLLAERERRIEELSARLATRTLEREGLAAELARSRPHRCRPLADALPPRPPPKDADVRSS